MPPPAPEGMNKWILIAMAAMIGTGLCTSLRDRRRGANNPMALTPVEAETPKNLDECLSALTDGNKAQTVYSAEGDQLTKLKNNGAKPESLMDRCMQVLDAKKKNAPVPSAAPAVSL